MQLINVKENNKLRIVRSDTAFTKHETIKLLIMLISRRKHPKAGIYSEYPLPNGDIVDVVVDLNNDLILYEVQKEISKDWLDRISKRDLDMTLKMFQRIDTQIIKLKELPDDLRLLEKELEVKVI